MKDNFKDGILNAHNVICKDMGIEKSELPFLVLTKESYKFLMKTSEWFKNNFKENINYRISND